MPPSPLCSAAETVSLSFASVFALKKHPPLDCWSGQKKLLWHSDSQAHIFCLLRIHKYTSARPRQTCKNRLDINAGYRENHVLPSFSAGVGYYFTFHTKVWRKQCTQSALGLHSYISTLNTACNVKYKHSIFLCLWTLLIQAHVNTRSNAAEVADFSSCTNREWIRGLHAGKHFENAFTAGIRVRPWLCNRERTGVERTVFCSWCEPTPTALQRSREQEKCGA